MSEIYLTKIERKTIFTRSLIFVLIMFVIADLTVTGPFYVNFIPWLYIIGTIGSVKKIDGVLMGIIASFTVFVSSTIMYGGVSGACLITTLIALITIVLGIFTGKCIYEFILEYRLVKYIKRSQKIVYIVASIVMLFVSWTIVSLNSGDIISYIASRNNLKDHISSTYGIQDYHILKTKYVRDVPGKYVHKVQIEGAEVTFVPVTKTVFKDANKDARLELAQQELNSQIDKTVQNVKQKYEYLKYATINYVLKYTDVGINSDTVILSITYNAKFVSANEQNADKLYAELVSCIEELQDMKKAEQIIITIGENTLNISKEHIGDITADYIKGGLDIEEIN